MVDVALSMRVYCAQRARFSAKLSTEKLWIFPTFRSILMPEGSPLQTATWFLLDQNFKPCCQHHRLLAKFWVAEEEREFGTKWAPVSCSKPQWTPANTEKQRGKSVAAGKRHGKTRQLFFLYRRTFFSLYFHTLWGLPNVGRWEGGCTRKKEWGRDDKKARAHKSKQTNRIKPGLKAVRRQRTERQDYDRSSAAQRTAGWWSNTGAAGPPQHVHGGPGGQNERKNWKNQKTTALPILLVGAVIIQAVRREREKSKTGFRGPDCMSTHQRGSDTERVPTWPPPGLLSHRDPRRSVHVHLCTCKGGVGE